MNKKELIRLKRHKRIRLRMQGVADKPRLVVKRSLNNLFAQVVDDANNKTVFSMATVDKQIKSQFPRGGNIKAAQAFGELFAKKALEIGIKRIVFDRAGYLYHGRIKAFADALRKGGLEF